MNKCFDVVSLGELLIDFTYVSNSKNGMKLFEQNPGGACGNLVCALSKLGNHTSLIAKVGNDMHGNFLIDTLNKEHVSTNYIYKDNNVFTTLAFVDVKRNGQREFSFARKPGADTCLTMDEVSKIDRFDTKIFHIGSLSLTNEPSRSATLFALHKAKEEGCIISYDPNYREPLWKNKQTAMKHMQSVLPFVDILKLSDEETDLITPYKDPKQALHYLLERGIKIVCVTKGSEGALIGSIKGMVEIDGLDVCVKDTTGAGDAFFASFLHKVIELKQGCDLELHQLEECGVFANAYAAYCTQTSGAIPSFASLEEIKEFISNINTSKK